MFKDEKTTLISKNAGISINPIYDAVRIDRTIAPRFSDVLSFSKCQLRPNMEAIKKLPKLPVVVLRTSIKQHAINYCA